MGTSVVEFGSWGYWLHDGHFELLLHFLGNEVDPLSNPPDWLLDLGRLRRVLILDEERRRPTKSLKDFIGTYNLEAAEISR